MTSAKRGPEGGVVSSPAAPVAQARRSTLAAAAGNWSRAHWLAAAGLLRARQLTSPSERRARLS